MGYTKNNGTLHLQNIFKEGELDKKSTAEFFSVVQNEGQREVKRNVEHYNLSAIISVGYRINSKEATAFRLWATKILKEYSVKGFVINREQMEQGNRILDKDYFKELLDIVRSIRASERRIWQQVTDIFAECSIDYDSNSPITQDFFLL